MTAEPIRRSGLPSVEYYAPDFRVRVESQEIAPESKGDILELKVTMELENLTSCELTINNWDDRSFDFKYIDTGTFDVGNRVDVDMGYAGAMSSMLQGRISRVSPRFPESGSPTLGVTVLNGMLQLRDRQPKDDDIKRFEDRADWQIAQVVAARNGLRAEVTREGPVHHLVVQKNQDDAQFLRERAARIDFDFYVQTHRESGEEALYFVRPTDGRSAGPTRVYTLEWGTSLIEFTPSLNISDQVAEVTVRGWDPRTRSPIRYTATLKDLPESCREGLSGPAAARGSLNGKCQTEVDAPVMSEEEARELAVSMLRERAYDFITGSGRVIGLPDLRPGDNLELLRLGRRFSGLYYVKKVEHTLGNSGYTTTFDVRKPCDGGMS